MDIYDQIAVNVKAQQDRERSAPPKVRPRLADRKPHSPRPGALPSLTYERKWPKIPEIIYITITNTVDQYGEALPFEIFINCKSAVYQEWFIGLSCSISALLRVGGDMLSLIAELEQIFSPAGGAWKRSENDSTSKYIGSPIAMIADVLKEHYSRLGLLENNEVKPLSLSSEKLNGLVKLRHSAVCSVCGAPAIIFRDGRDECLSCGYLSCA